MGLFFLMLFLGFPKIFTKPQKLSITPKVQKKTKETPKNPRENQQNTVFKSFRPTLGYVFFVVLGFPEGF